MKIYKGFEEASVIRNPVVTTGSFDGVHIGHKTILNRLSKLAEKYDGESVLITFHPHPRKVLYPESAGKDLKLINSQEEKLDLLRKTGLRNIIIIEFTREFSKITSEEFVKDYLHGMLNAKVVVAGFNHHFGFNKEGDYKQLWGWQKKYKFEAEEIPEQEVYNETVSSTRIRQAISEGYIQRANAYLDHYYFITGKPHVFQNKVYRLQDEFYEIPVTEECKLLPAPGIYAVTAESDSCSSKGMAVITRKGESSPEVIVNIFDNPAASEELRISILFHKKVYDAVNLSDSSTSDLLDKAKDEISDLIY